jgi:hypothetical protein
MYGVDRWGTGTDGHDWKMNGMALTVNDIITGGKTEQYTSDSPPPHYRANFTFFAGSQILDLEEDDTIGMMLYQDNGIDEIVTVSDNVYMNILKLG